VFASPKWPRTEIEAGGLESGVGRAFTSAVRQLFSPRGQRTDRKQGQPERDHRPRILPDEEAQIQPRTTG
jgi:hypothetical protein